VAWFKKKLQQKPFDVDRPNETVKALGVHFSYDKYAAE
jgi:hypothetical protein